MDMHFKRIFILALTISASAMSFAQEALGEFSKIRVQGRIELSIKYGQPKGISVNADDNLKQAVQYSVADGCLDIKAQQAIPRGTMVVAVVSCPTISEIEIGGGARCFNSGTIKEPTLTLIAGAATEFDLLVDIDSASVKVMRGGFARLTGNARSAYIKTSTGGSYVADEMDCKTLVADMNGGGIARVKVSETINANLAPKARMIYVGSPKIIETETSKGEITNEED